MKSRILAFALTLALLLGIANIVAFATEAPSTPTALRPLTSATNPIAGDKQISTAQQLDDYQARLISAGLSASTVTTTGTETLTPQEIADLSNIQNGFSVIGATAATRSLATATDGKWTNNAAYLTKFTVGGASNYNEKGESGANYQYKCLLTFNFGKAVDIQSFGYIVANLNDMPQSADIYVGTEENGEITWELVNAYNRTEAKNASKEFGFINISQAAVAGATGNKNIPWEDAENAIPTAQNQRGGRAVIFDLSEVHTAQYLRIAATSLTGADGTTKDVAVAEILVFGNDTQISMNAVQTKVSENGNAKFDARFVAEVNEFALGAKQINFRISASYTDSNNSTAVSVSKEYIVANVYTSIQADNENVSPTNGYYFAVFKINDIPTDVAVTFTIIPEIQYENGAVVVGTAATVTFPTTQE